mmetsp:Transcript_91206/g.162429  ORF Transcript_91206/g.162429 Transcript_91206/m.162429 type:complete len:390 (-) Transcript_91206:42-1211(-)
MPDMAGQLRLFLRTRFGSLKAAFSALDVSAQGKLSEQDFEAGLKKFGFTADARPVFTALQEASGSGDITLRTFVSGMMVGDADETTKVFSMSPATPRCHSEGHLPPTLLPKPPLHGSMGAPPSPMKPGVRASSQGPTVEKVSSTSEARIKHLEEQLVLEQSHRLETELRLTEYLHRAISEEFDALKRELRQEQAERRAMKAELQDLRSRLTGASFTPGMDALNRLKHLEGEIDRLASPDQDDGKASTATRSLTLDTSSIHSENVLPETGTSGTPGVPRRAQSPSTLLRQQNLRLREENLALREQAVEAKEKEKTKQRDLGSGNRAESPAMDLRSRAPSPSCHLQSPPRPQSPPQPVISGKGLARQPPGSFHHQSLKGAGLSSARGKGFA